MQPLHKNWQLERDLSFFQLRPLVKGGVATRIVSQSSVCRDAAAPRNHVAAALQAAADPDPTSAARRATYARVTCSRDSREQRWGRRNRCAGCAAHVAKREG